MMSWVKCSEAHIKGMLDEYEIGLTQHDAGKSGTHAERGDGFQRYDARGGTEQSVRHIHLRFRATEIRRHPRACTRTG